MTTTAQRMELRLSEDFILDLEAYAKPGLRAVVLGSSGAGKSYTVRVMCEEILAAGISVVIFDTEDEYYSLAEVYPTVIVGGPQAHLPLPLAPSPEFVRSLVEIPLRRPGIALIFELNDLGYDAQQRAFTTYANAIFQAKKPGTGILFMVMEEAELFAPEGAKGDVLTAATLARRGRKRGLYTVWTPHRTADFSKRVLSQCNLTLVGRLEDIRDFKAIEYKLPPNTTFAQVNALDGEMMVGGGNQPGGHTIRVRKAYTTHIGETPGIQVTIAMPQGDLAESIKQLAMAAESSAPDADEETPAKRRAPAKDIADATEALRLEYKDELEKLTTRHQAIFLEKDRQLEAFRADHELIEVLKGLLARLLPQATESPITTHRTLPTMKPPEFLLDGFQKKTVAELSARIGRLTTAQKGVLQFLIAIKGRAHRTEIAKKVTGTGGKQFTGQAISSWHGQHLTPLVKAGFISVQNKTSDVFYTLPEVVKAEMKVYNPTEEAIAQVIAQVEHGLATESPS